MQKYPLDNEILQFGALQKEIREFDYKNSVLSRFLSKIGLKGTFALWTDFQSS